MWLFLMVPHLTSMHRSVIVYQWLPLNSQCFREMTSHFTWKSPPPKPESPNACIYWCPLQYRTLKWATEYEGQILVCACGWVLEYLYLLPVLDLIWIKSSIYTRNKCSFFLSTKAKTELGNIPPLWGHQILISQLSLWTLPLIQLINYCWLKSRFLSAASQ